MVDAAIKDSVQDLTFEKERVYAPGGGALWFVPGFDYSSVLPAWGTPYRDYVLRTYSRAMHNTLFMATLNNLGSEIASTPWQLYGKRNRDKFQKIILGAEFGAGWRVFCKKFCYAYGVYDFGVPIEVIGRGDALKPISGNVEGFATLDPIYCELTGNVEYPIIFRSQRGGYHRLHSSRVHRIVDNPQIDRDFYGRGQSALSRYFGTAWLQILMGRYGVEKLSDLPPAGIAILNNISNFQDVWRQYEADRRADGAGVWRNVAKVENYDTSKDASIEFVSFATLPEQFDYDTWQKRHIELVALSIGVDPQDVAPLTGAAMGTGAQSFVLDVKSRRKTPGLLLKELETFLNLYVLPAYLEFKFTPRDEEGELREAETAQAWVNVVNSVPGLSEQQKLQLLVAKVQAVQDVATDKQGNLMFVDTDVPDTAQDVVPADDTTVEGTDMNDGPPTDDTEAPAAPGGDTEEAGDENSDETPDEEDEDKQVKAYSSTRDDFERAISATIDSAVAGDLTRVRAGIIVRAELDKFGRKAMLDGLGDGGVDASTLEGDDLATFNTWKVEQSAYVADLMDAIFKEGVQYTGDGRAQLWSRKSLDVIYQKGLLSADANGLYEWVLGHTEEHCSTCLKMNGVIKRLSVWHKDGVLPQSSELECGGFNCDCGLKRRRKKMLALPVVVRFVAQRKIA